jgi:hypothetical protein
MVTDSAMDHMVVATAVIKEVLFQSNSTARLHPIISGMFSNGASLAMTTSAMIINKYTPATESL